MSGNDKLDAIFLLQKKLQDRLGVEVDQNYISMMTLACIDELLEALRETPWKPWKKQQRYYIENYKDELVDALHFFINLCIAAGMTPENLYARYIKKHDINIERHKDGY